MLLALALGVLATVTGTNTTPALRAVGDHYMSLTPLLCHVDCFVEIADLAHPAVITLHASRDALEHRFGHHTVATRVGRYNSLSGTLVSYTRQRAGFLFSDSGAPGSSFWYGELDSATGAIVSATKLVDWTPATDAYVVGVDSEHRAAWFEVERYSGPRRPAAGYARERSASAMDFLRVDLDTLAVTTPVSLALPARLQQPPLEDQLFVHHADDFSHFAVVEYYEEPHHMTPAAKMYVVDPGAGTSFDVAIPEVVYAVAFAPDDRYAYLSSSVSGEVARVDLVLDAIDKRVTGPKLTHEAVITPDGQHLLVLGSAKSYVEYELPELTHAREIRHDAAVAPAFDPVYLAAARSLDGSQLVIETGAGSSSKTQDYAIVRVR